MNISSRIMAAVIAVILSAAAYGCNSKTNTSSSSSAENTTAASSDEAVTASDTETSTDSSAPATTAVSTTSEKTTETTTTTAAEKTTEKPAEPTTAEARTGGFGSSFEAAKAYYNAYITNNADAVYDMFCPEEIEAYHSYIGTTDLLDGKNPQVVFKRSAVIDAIKQSMAAIRGIMAEKSDLPPEQWTTSLAEDTLRATGENELKDFNKTLSTEFTAGSDCRHVYYEDGAEEHRFVGNGCAFVELGGRWYLSYSSVMNAELITYMDIY